MSKALNELKKATMASYLSKAGRSLRSGVSLSKSFDDEAGKQLSKIVANHPNVYTGKSKDPAALKDAEGKYDAATKLSGDYARQAKNRIKGIALAGRRLAKEETVNEAPLSPEHKAAIKTLKNIPSNYSHRDLQLLKKHTGAVADKASDAEYSARYEKQQRVQNKNKKRTVKETGSSIKNQEGHILHMKKVSINSNDYTAHVGRGGPQVDAGSWSAIRYKHKIGGYNRHFNKAAFDKKFNTEEVEPVNEVSRSTIAKVAQARYNQAQKALKDKNYHEYVQKMKKAIKAGDATTPKTGWSHEEETQLPEAEPIVEVSAQEKYRKLREAKVTRALGQKSTTTHHNYYVPHDQLQKASAALKRNDISHNAADHSKAPVDHSVISVAHKHVDKAHAVLKKHGIDFGGR